jgi:hypothetical protein
MCRCGALATDEAAEERTGAAEMILAEAGTDLETTACPIRGTGFEEVFAVKLRNCCACRNARNCIGVRTRQNKRARESVGCHLK